MKKLTNKKFIALLLCLTLALTALLTVTAFADEPTNLIATQTEETTSADDGTSAKAIASGIAIGIAACGGAFGMGMAISKSTEGISRQPEAEGKIRTTMMLGLVFLETVVIYALLTVILIIFVL